MLKKQKPAGKPAKEEASDAPEVDKEKLSEDIDNLIASDDLTI